MNEQLNEQLNEDILMHICLQLNCKDLLNVKLVCKMFYNVCSQNIIWKNRYINDLSDYGSCDIYDENNYKFVHNNKDKLLKMSDANYHDGTYLSYCYKKLLRIPKWICSFNNMWYLDLSHNCIEKIPTEIKNMNELAFLYLNNNLIKKVPSEMFQLINLEELFLHNNQIEILSDEFKKLKKLEYFTIYNNKINNTQYKIKYLINDISQHDRY